MLQDKRYLDPDIILLSLNPQYKMCFKCAQYIHEKTNNRFLGSLTGLTSFNWSLCYICVINDRKNKYMHREMYNDIESAEEIYGNLYHIQMEKEKYVLIRKEQDVT